MHFMGIDPGATGAATIIALDQLERLHLRILNFKTRNTGINVYELNSALAIHHFESVYFEDVHSRDGNSAQSNYTFGKNTGYAEAILRLNGYEWRLVLPQRWQKELGLIKRYPTTSARKQDHLRKAKSLFPECKDITLANADSVLIAYYGYLQYKKGQTDDI